MEHVTLFMFLPGTVIHAIYPAWNQQGSVWLTNSESPSKMLTVFFADYLRIGPSALASI